MSFAVFLCRRCGAHAFPRRWLCPACGARDWLATPGGPGRVEESTVVRHRLGATGPVENHLATVALAQGPRVIARLDQPLERGAAVTVEAGPDGALHARPAHSGA